MSIKIKCVTKPYLHKNNITRRKKTSDTCTEKNKEDNQYIRTIMISNRRMLYSQVSSENTLTTG